MNDPLTEVGGGTILTYAIVALLKKWGMTNTVTIAITVVIVSAILQTALVLLEQPGATGADWGRAIVRAVIAAILASAAHLGIKNAQTSIKEAKA